MEIINASDINEEWLHQNDFDVRDDLYVEDFIKYRMEDMDRGELEELALNALAYFYSRNPAKLTHDIEVNYADWFIFYHTHQEI